MGSHENNPPSRGNSQDDRNMHSLPDDPYGNVPSNNLRPEINDNLSSHVKSEKRGPEHYNDGRLYLASREKPRTEVGDFHNQDNNPSIDGVGAPPSYYEV